MMEKRSLFNVMLFCLAVVPAGWGQTLRPVRLETALQPYVYLPEWYSWTRGDSLSNQFQTHNITSVRWHATPQREARTEIKYGGSTGFTGLSPFLQITVNDIPHTLALLDDSHFSPWQNGKMSGFEMRLNFDGAGLRLRFFMRPDSPVLWGAILPGTENLEAIRSCRLTFTALPSKLVKDNSGKVLWSGPEVYRRAVRTEARVIQPVRGGTLLQAGENWLVFQDELHDGSSEDKGEGPCLLLLNFDGIAVATALPGNEWLARVNVNLKPDFQTFHFGLFNHPVRISNPEFFQKLENNRPAFSFRKE